MPKRKGNKNDSGGLNAPRHPNGNIDWAEVYSKYLRPILDRQPAPNTIRGLMYILKSQGILKKTDYNTLDKRLVDWRLQGLVDWNAIADDSGRSLIGDFDGFMKPETWIGNKIDSLKDAASEFRYLLNNQWRWFGQPNYVEFMTEKQAVTATVYSYVEDRYVKISYNKGNNGWGWAHTYAEMLKDELEYYDFKTRQYKPRKVYLWYLGDDDKYGRHMDGELRNQLRQFGILDKIHFERIAVLPKQVK
jgi:hypothetical protein